MYTKKQSLGVLTGLEHISVFQEKESYDDEAKNYL